MKITAKLKAWAVANLGCKAEASDDEVRPEVLKAIGSGKLSPETLTDLSLDEAAKSVSPLMQALTAIAEGQKSISEALKGGAPAAATAGAGAAKAAAAPAGAVAPAGAKAVSHFEKLFAGADDEGADLTGESLVRVKGAHEQYSNVKSALVAPQVDSKNRKHPLAGQQLREGGFDGTGRAMEAPSELDKAIIGAYTKFAIFSEMGGRNIPNVLKMTDHDRDLLQYALRNSKWGGVLGGDCTTVEGAQGVKGTKLSDVQIKTLLDDSGSGGLEIAPIAFDDAIITIPLLSGEFFPAVNTVPITRGRRIEGASMGNVTLSSGGADDTDIPLFNTASFVSAFDTSIFVVNGAIEIGMDFLSDSPIDVANAITAQYGQKLLVWLDEQICIGDGTTEPEGISLASGTTSVSFGSAAATVGKYESMLFGISKAYKQGYPKDRIRFGGTETSYQRARAIPVGASDERRIFGMTHEDYTLFGHPYGICEALGNTKIFFANLARYRMYRRLGLTLKVTTEGKTLVRANKMLITARARYGGQLEDGAAAAYTSTAAA